MRPGIITVTVTATAVLLGSGAAAAANTGFYLGGALGQSESGVRNSSFNFKDRDSGYKLIAGFRPLSLLALELNYVDLGKSSVSGAQAKTKAVDGFLVGYLPVPVIDIYGKLGLASWKTDASVPGLSLHITGSDPAAGAGVQVHFGGLAARLEYEIFNAKEVAKPTLLSLGLTYTFL
jgi:Outer membrane protein beta-barrel domain